MSVQLENLVFAEPSDERMGLEILANGARPHGRRRIRVETAAGIVPAELVAVEGRYAGLARLADGTVTVVLRGMGRRKGRA
jgi:hypothetical protein